LKVTKQVNESNEAVVKRFARLMVKSTDAESSRSSTVRFQSNC